jgi:hypothetical protein
LEIEKRRRASNPIETLFIFIIFPSLIFPNYAAGATIVTVGAGPVSVVLSAEKILGAALS